MKLSRVDIQFIRNQLDLWNNPLTDPTGTILSNSGIRNVSGYGNNIMNPTWGSADTLFPRITYNKFDNGYTPQTGGFKLNLGTGVVSYDNGYQLDYSTRGTTLYDAQPRIISNLISNQNGLTNLQVQDDPSSTPDGRLSPLTGNTNPLAYSSYMTLFGQFFDHGLDFVHKGVDGNVIVPLLPGDSLYSTAPGAANFMMASRTNTVNVTIGEGSTDALVSSLGLTDVDPNTGGNQSMSWNTVTGSTILNGSFSGSLVLNNILIQLNSANRQGVVDAINAQTSATGVTASLDGSNHLVLTPATDESFNTISPFIDLSQSYGSAPSHTVFLREYDDTGAVTGRLVSGNADGNGTADSMATWADIKANALKIGITLHDYNVTDIPLVRLNADGTTYFDANGDAWLVALNKTSGEIVYVQNTGKLALDTANLTLMTTGHAFLDDMAHGVLSGLNSNGDLSGAAKTSLEQHFIAGDGRANENIGLTAIHDVFHAEHARVLEDIKSFLTLGADNIYRDDTGKVWTGEDLFQAAKFVTEMEYQHLVFGEFARKLSPNINAFAGYDISIDAAISAEFAHAVYRFGHSMLTETVAMTAFGADGISTGVDNSMGLIEAFLNPGAYTDSTAGEIAIGMSGQVGNAIDEWVTPALRDNLVGLPLDLATLNIVRGRDAGIPTLNEVRQSLFDQTGMTTLKPYASWDEFGAHLLHPEALKNFIMAYARDAVLTQFGGNASVDYWNNLQLTDTSGYASALSNAASLAMNNATFMTGGNTDFWDIDLWIGGLAEEKVTGGMLGSTFDFIFAMQMINLQNGDRVYYLDRLAGTNMLAEIESQLFSDIVMRNTGVKHLYSDIFSVADKYLELKDFQSNSLGSKLNPYASLSSLRNDVTTVKDAENVDRSIGKAGYVGDTFYGNDGNYLDARGVFNPNGSGNASEMIGGTDLADKINGLGGNDTIWGDAGNDIIEGGFGNDFLHGGDGNDIITDSEGSDLIWGDGGDDLINAGNGLDQVFGGDGNDTLYGGLGADVVDGQIGDDVIFGDNGAGATYSIIKTGNIITGVTVSGVMDSTGDADIIQGGVGDDVLFGGGGADALDGGEGNDWLIGGGGNDAMIGWDGDDHFIMDASDIGYNHAIDGGLGFDIVDYSASNGGIVNGQRIGVSINLSNAGPAVVPVGVNVPDSFLSVEGAIGSQYNDSIIGGPAVQIDQAGNPLPLLDANGNPVQQVDVNGNPVFDPLTGLPVFATIPMNFYLDGAAGNDHVEGGDGDDILIGGLGDDTLIGGLGIDTASYANETSRVTVNLGTANAQNTTGAGRDTLSGIENLRGSAFNDTLTGSAANNLIEGGDGNDSINGGNGNDILIGGAGNDTLNGGGGNDTASYIDATGGVTVSLAITNAQNTVNAGSDTLTSIENLTGSAFNDTLTGSNAANILNGGAGNDNLNGGAGNDTLIGGAGNDTIDGGAGTDAVQFSGNFADYTISYNTGLARFTIVDNRTNSPDGTDILTTIENLVFADRTVAASTYIPPQISATATVAQAEGDIGTTAFNYTVTLSNAYVYDVVINYTVSAGSATASDFSGSVLPTGSITILAGQTSGVISILVAGDLTNENNETFNVNLTTPTAGVSFSNATLSGTIQNDDPVAIIGNGANETLNGTNARDIIYGRNGNDTINGLGGNDTLFGENGNDTLNGGTGSDTMVGGSGDDIYFVDNAGDVVIEDLASGTDLINVSGLTGYTLGANIENLTFTGTGAFAGNGNELNNIIIGNTGNDVLNGGLGNDNLSGNSGTDTLNGGDGNDILNGGANRDQLTGGIGSDTFVFTIGDSGITNGSLDVINDYGKGAVGTGDLIDFSSTLRIGGNASGASTTQASINNTTGIATFAGGSGTTLNDAVNDIAARFSAATDTAGEFAFFKVNNTGSYYMFISDGAAGASANDVVVQLVGVTTINSIDLTSGNLTITA